MIDTANLAIPERPSYGAVEIKAFIKKATWRAFGITVALFILAFLISLTVSKIQEASSKVIKAPPVVMKLDNLQQQADEAQTNAPPPPDQIINNGPAARAGSPVPVPDALIAPDMKDIATVDVQSRASSVGGDGIDMGEMSANVDVNRPVEIQQQIEVEPDRDVFVATEKDADIDPAEIAKKVVYPEVAKRANIEGTVYVRVLVGKDGRPKKQEVVKSDAEILNRAALDAVRNSVFTPGIQNGSPITMWITIPIKFNLK